MTSGPSYYAIKLSSSPQEARSSKGGIKVRHGYHVVSDCCKARQSSKSHEHVEAPIIYYLTTGVSRA
jgi:hypothetical protein